MPRSAGSAPTRPRLDHGVTALGMAVTLSSANIWSVWSSEGDQARARFFAAAVPVAYWGPFWRPWFPAPLLMTRLTLLAAWQGYR